METGWQVYRELELIPDSVPEPKKNKQILTLPLRLAWKILIKALGDELVHEQKIEYLERCLAISDFEDDTKNTWRKLWVLMN